VKALITGASGVLGSRVARHLADSGVEVLAGSRRLYVAPFGVSVVVDPGTGEGLPEALRDVETVVHCASDARRHRRVDHTGTINLLSAARSAGVRHFVYPGIVGSDVVPLGYYQSKIAAENAIMSSGIQWTVLRTTQFHQFIWRVLEGISKLPIMLVPNDTRVQPLDPSVVAGRLARAVIEGPAGRLEDLGGPTAYEFRDLARSYLAASGRKRPLLRVNVPGIVGAALRAGGNLTPNRDTAGMTWNDFVRSSAAAANEV